MNIYTIKFAGDKDSIRFYFDQAKNLKLVGSDLSRIETVRLKIENELKSGPKMLSSHPTMDKNNFRCQISLATVPKVSEFYESAVIESLKRIGFEVDPVLPDPQLVNILAKIKSVDMSDKIRQSLIEQAHLADVGRLKSLDQILSKTYGSVQVLPKTKQSRRPVG